MTIDELQGKLDEMAFVSFYGLKIESLAAGRCVTRIPYHVRLDRPGGIVAGPTFMMTADVSFWLALVAEFGIDTPMVTANMQTVFLNSCKGEDVMCEVKILKMGRRLIFGTAECRSRGGILFTHHSITYARIIAG